MVKLLRVNNHIITFNVATKRFEVGVDPFSYPFSTQGPLYAFQVESQRHESKINEVTYATIQLLTHAFVSCYSTNIIRVADVSIVRSISPAIATPSCEPR